MSDALKLTPVEGIKARSNFLRGTLLQSLADSATGALAEDDTQLSKFHGFYQQDDRDVRDERRRQMLEPDHQFMIRARVPGGICTPNQWLAMDAIATEHANGTIRLTTRQAFQLHGVVKRRLKPTIKGINESLLDTIAACGDVNRNVMSTVLPEQSAIHRRVFDDAAAVSRHLTPHTNAYHEIWLDGEKLTGAAAEQENEPIYGKTYLPRKFKMSFAIPPRNDVDVFAHDLSFIAIVGKGELQGYNVVVGGGMGVTHGDPKTYPRLASVVGFCTPEQVLEVSETIVTIQRDFGDRTERKHARLKYTLDDHGEDWLHQQFSERAGYRLAEPRDYVFTHTGDRLGWQQTDDGLWHLGLFIENGRVKDVEGSQQLTGLREIAKILKGEFRLTPNQNLVLAKVADADRADIDAIVTQHGLDSWNRLSPLRQNALACVGFPTCGLAMAESERYLPDLVGQIEQLLAKHDLLQQAITIRMTGCPNGCARPYLAEIGLVGKGPGLYNLHLGAAFNGTRLNSLFRESVQEADVLEVLDQLFGDYAADRNQDEHFGDFLFRQGLLSNSTHSTTADPQPAQLNNTLN
ncbi:MAG TPA: NADPH-dependent assimilatory sulfite reductase hemoprotein subunit [Xanthomonadales bacterium]|nr:NADPH-dependent assimilatory sulfite reductase hemoprotein subunit [Xanthomonadales bacterium]